MSSCGSCASERERQRLLGCQMMSHVNPRTPRQKMSDCPLIYLGSDDDETTRWGAALGTRSGWLEVDLGTDRTFGRALINQEGWNRIGEFELQRWNGDSGETFYASADGERLEGKLDLEFPPVTARRVRLNITKSTEVITIWEFQLFQQ